MPYRCLDGDEYSTTVSNVEPADKYNVRRYIKGVCSAPMCADTFFLYLSSPTRRDGNALLWDANGNGIVSYQALNFFTNTSRMSAILPIPRSLIIFKSNSMFNKP